MSRTTLNRWLQPLAILLVIVLIVMLLIPAELTNARFAQIKQGMSIAVARQLLGQENGYATIACSTPGIFWMKDRKWWLPSLRAKVEGDATTCLFSGGSLWFSDNHLLVVEHNHELVTRTWMLPITSSGGGVQGCIDTIKEYWNQWMK